ncbi:(d)CMP kinase [Natronoflexus pectinivorans]|uniref:Cytidylate kinase n=1 Tax=Natronoflexus pectinivorans TaxID=682526 RepID=A0A4R2GNF9_9BACT|nr:(d)CMP kinase [Natronoflexus pectinivorans]TCO10610.1 cytidylate kinase [Natronoflexus pectinivorans]
MSKPADKIIIAIDGHSSCGKSTIAKDLAKKLNLIYIDTGAMYRAVTLFALSRGFINNDGINADKLRNSLSEIVVEFKRNSSTGELDTWLNGENVEKAIRTLEVSNNVSAISALKFVRERMVKLQQEMGQSGGVVLDGRDIGTVVFPNADLKLFMTASPEVRAQRRFDEMQSKGECVTFEDVLSNVQNRDHIDSTRVESPLRKADDALVLDNSFMDREEQFDWVLEKLSERGLYKLLQK